LPAAHFEQMAVPEALAMVPGAQGVGAVEPVVHEDPGGQTVQSVACARLGTFEYVPSRHGS
jgi:hypothetical protein